MAKETAIRRLERSKLDPRVIQREMMGDDLDLEKLVIYLKGKIKFDAADRVIDVQVARTIEGASTVTIMLNDYDHTILNSGLLNSGLDIQIDGLWFRLVKVARNQGSSDLELTFEDREICVLRSYPKTGTPHNGVKFAHRSQVTRAEFILNLIREVKEFKIPVVIPHLHEVQEIEKAIDTSSQWGGSTTDPSAKEKGINPNINSIPKRKTPSIQDMAALKVHQSQAYYLTVKGVAASKEQIRNANIILATGNSMKLGPRKRKLLVCSIMVAIVESTLHNYAGGDLDSVGLFQQRDSWGSYSDRHDPATSARLFFQQAIKIDGYNPDTPKWQLCAEVQLPNAAYAHKYADYEGEAERFVTEYGIPGGDSESSAASANNSQEWSGSSSDFIYYRGVPRENAKVFDRENNWDCITRLAQEVQWRAFFVSGVFFLLTEDDLFKTQPIMIVDPTSAGIDEPPGFDYDVGKKTASVSLGARIGTWLAPPGSVAALQHMGPVNGRWLVTDFSRSLFDSKADIVLKKPLPKLPEPLTGPISEENLPSWATNKGATQPPPNESTFGGVIINYQMLPGGRYMAVLPTDPKLSVSEFEYLDQEGAPDSSGKRHHAAKDWFAPGGTALVAPCVGTVIEVTPSKGSSGQVYGGVVKIAESDGHVWVFRHIAPAIGLAVGVVVAQGQKIANVVTWADVPSSSHCHIEIWRTIEGGYFFGNMIDPVSYMTGGDRGD